MYGKKKYGNDYGNIHIDNAYHLIRIFEDDDYEWGDAYKAVCSFKVKSPYEVYLYGMCGSIDRHNFKKILEALRREGWEVVTYARSGNRKRRVLLK